MFNTHEELVEFQRKVMALGAELEQEVRVIRYNLPSRSVWWECVESAQKNAAELAKLLGEAKDGA